VTPSCSSFSPSSQPRWFSTEPKKGEEEAAAAAEQGQGQEEAAPTEEPVAVVSNEEALEGQVKTLKDQLLRSLAEQENTRQIARKDVAAAKNYAIKSFAKSLLEVSDNLQRALDSVPQDELNAKNNEQLISLYQGIEMTNRGLIKAFDANGVQKFCEEPGDVFNPEKHEALMEYPDPTKEPGTVGQVIKKGYTLNNRVLRHAEVGVVKKP
jgi:molecular chaperone GrpE